MWLNYSCNHQEWIDTEREMPVKTKAKCPACRSKDSIRMFSYVEVQVRGVTLKMKKVLVHVAKR